MAEAVQENGEEEPVKNIALDEELLLLLKQVVELRKIVPEHCCKLLQKEINADLESLKNLVYKENDKNDEEFFQKLEELKRMNVPEMNTEECAKLNEKINNKHNRMEDVHKYLLKRKEYKEVADE